ncbi:MAG: hypothetical protein M1830_009534 [Pleopsidium flavum]|nr:MAG: hypothetical protein M1830_009534 [Pleopsidium flavum]
MADLRKPRLRNACDACHSAKTKCSGTKPLCKRCAQQTLDCVYSECARMGKPPRSSHTQTTPKPSALSQYLTTPSPSLLPLTPSSTDNLDIPIVWDNWSALNEMSNPTPEMSCSEFRQMWQSTDQESSMPFTTFDQSTPFLQCNAPPTDMHAQSCNSMVPLQDNTQPDVSQRPSVSSTSTSQSSSHSSTSCILLCMQSLETLLQPIRRDTFHRKRLHFDQALTCSKHAMKEVLVIIENVCNESICSCQCLVIMHQVTELLSIVLEDLLAGHTYSDLTCDSDDKTADLAHLYNLIRLELGRGLVVLMTIEQASKTCKAPGMPNAQGLFEVTLSGYKDRIRGLLAGLQAAESSRAGGLT